jgi:hypothetical protein
LDIKQLISPEGLLEVGYTTSVLEVSNSIAERESG